MRIWEVTLVLIISSSRVYSADNVCPRIKNYTVTSMETYTEPVVVNTFTWCLQIPPRCPKTRTEMRQRYRIKTESKTKSINECCEGYRMISSTDNETGIRCVPSCENCLTGTCVSPGECQCGPGYQGDNCEEPCPAGTWGWRCKEKCNCAREIHCNPINGHCLCPAGLRGRMCDESCPDDRWGPRCELSCNCKNLLNKCDLETGECLDDPVPDRNESSSKESVEGEASDFASAERGEGSEILERIESATPGHTGGEVAFDTTDNPVKPMNPESSTASTSDHPKIRTQAEEDGNSSTARPVIVLVSVPERRRNTENDRGKFPMKNPFIAHVDDNVDLHDIVSSKTDYVKNVHKDDVQPAPIPLDIALIVVASIVSLGLTSVAVVMVLHMRSKLFETARLSIYEEQKTKKQETSNGNRISSIVTSALPQTPVRVSTVFTSNPEPETTMSIDTVESNNYANGAAVMTLRLSGNLRDRLFSSAEHADHKVISPGSLFPDILQDDHYDRPPATRIRLQSDLDANTEHIYDEIPLQSSPLCTRINP